MLIWTLLFRIRTWNKDRVPRRGGVLLASNHQSFLDPPLVGGPLPRQVCYMARRSLFDVPGCAWWLRGMKCLPVKRTGVDRRAMRVGIELMSRGEGLVVFPEGTRTPDGEVKPFRSGFALLAARAEVPIVPVAVHGADKAWPRHRRLPRPSPVHVAYGEPVVVGGTGKGACREAAVEVYERVIALREELKQRD